MAEIKKVGGQAVIDYMARDYDSLLQSMQALIPEKLPEWKDHTSEADFGRVLLELFAHMGDILSYYQDRVVNESFLATAQSRRSIIQHLRLIGYSLSTAAPASAALRLSFPESCNETLRIQKGDAFATKSQKDKASVRFEYTRALELEIDCATLPVIAGRKIYEGLPVEEGRLVKNDVLARSDGSKNQRYPLAQRPFILRALSRAQQIQADIILLTELGGRIEEWHLQESLAFSRERQKDFLIAIDENDQATIVFGDGAFGAIPASGAEIRVTYRVGGGRFGNVIAGAIQTIIDAPQLILLGAKVINVEAATGGADREDIGDAVQHAPKVYRSLKRAVTQGDYEALALDFRGVGKVRAEGTNWNTVKLFIAPEGGGHVSDVLQANLLAYFEDKRAVSTLIEIQDVRYVEIFISATLEVESYYANDEVKDQVQVATAALLAFESVDFAQTLYLSKFYEAIEAIDGVRGVNISEFRTERESSGTVDAEGKLVLGSNEIPIVPASDSLYRNGILVLTDGGGL